MSDPLVQLLDRHGIHTYFGGASCGCGWDGPHYTEHLAEVIAREFLVVPHAAVEAVDYYVYPSPRESGAIFTDRATALAEAADRGVEVRERPRLPWAPIRPEVPDGK